MDSLTIKKNPLYLTTPEINQPIYHPSPIIIDNHNQKIILNNDQYLIHHYSSNHSSFISMNKQNDYSEIVLINITLTNQYIWKAKLLDKSIDSYKTSSKPNDNYHNSNIIDNNLSEESISSTS